MYSRHPLWKTCLPAITAGFLFLAVQVIRQQDRYRIACVLQWKVRPTTYFRYSRYTGITTWKLSPYCSLQVVKAQMQPKVFQFDFVTVYCWQTRGDFLSSHQYRKRVKISPMWFRNKHIFSELWKGCWGFFVLLPCLPPWQMHAVYGCHRHKAREIIPVRSKINKNNSTNSLSYSAQNEEAFCP